MGKNGEEDPMKTCFSPGLYGEVIFLTPKIFIDLDVQNLEIFCQILKDPVSVGAIELEAKKRS